MQDNSIDLQFIEFIVKSLVGNPDAVKIERRIDEKGVLLELTVDPEDLGRVIGKRGATAQSLRTLLRALGTKNDARYNLKIVDNGEPRPPREYNDRPADNNGGYSHDNSASASDDTMASSSASAPAATPASDDEDTFMTSLKDDFTPQQESNLSSKTRKELEELDDLDI